ncbi:O-acetyl-ADP-ribose deacetylase [Jatrophihabitans sp.]|jgi:O-acetyl-ADP-ribose deacetylase (regulator of RNase III)|uniref:O-acetyl-ADP-ribose deacetylase n=1 Tax=Jatrophihabitans sp. TaxID=1932789 RepID=UPI002EFE1117
MRLELVLGDITEQHVDAVVNAANSSLLGGSGVDGAIHRRGGPEILRACRALRAGAYPNGLPAGQAVATTAGLLPAGWVIHTVGPVYSEREDRSQVLRSCYRESLRVAAELGARSIAFPLISAGAYRWPVRNAIELALAELRSAPWPDAAGTARLVLWQPQTLALARDVLAATTGPEPGTA